MLPSGTPSRQGVPGGVLEVGLCWGLTPDCADCPTPFRFVKAGKTP